MTTRPYFSMREGRRPPTYDLEMAKRLFLAMYDDLVERGYFAELTGYECIDQGPLFDASMEPRFRIAAREALSSLIDEVQKSGRSIAITRHGKPAAVLMNMEAIEKKMK